jgi:uncharacterized protein YegL
MVLPAARSRKKPPPNPEPRCPVIWLLDTSKSMQGAKGDGLNGAVQLFHGEISRDDLASHRVELAIVPFGESVRVSQDFTAVAAIEKILPFTFEGNTPMAGAILKSLELLKSRKEYYKAEGIDAPYRPWVVLVTDGAPTDHDLIPKAREALFKAVGEHRLTFYPVGVQGADFEFLKTICPAGQKVFELEGLKFSRFFQWLSRSLKSVSHEDPDNEPPVENPDGVKEAE